MNKQAMKLIKKFEGFSPTPYACAGGYWTVGWGHRLGPNEPRGPLTYAQAKELLARDVERCERAIRKLVHVPLDTHQEAALISFVFNVGAAAFQRSTLRMKVNREEHHDVPAEFHRWVWCKGRKLPGLVVRRQAEAQWYGGRG
ncbi:MAG: lysozyme [Alphaproteobacteria bacterium]